MNRTVLDLWVGVFVVVGLAALLFLALKVGSLNTLRAADSYEVVARFENIGGLKPHAPVKSAGVVVGRVGEIGFDDTAYQAAVTLRLDKRYTFPRDTTAAIMTSGLLGEQYIGLEAGSDETRLKDKDRIEITQDAVILENLIGQFLYGKAHEGQPQ